MSDTEVKFEHPPYKRDTAAIVAATIAFQKKLPFGSLDMKTNLEYWEYVLQRDDRNFLLDDHALDLLASDIAALQVKLGYK